MINLLRRVLGLLLPGRRQGDSPSAYPANERERADRLYHRGHQAIWGGPSTEVDRVIRELEDWGVPRAVSVARRLREERDEYRRLNG